MSVTLEIHVTSRHGILPGEQPVQLQLRLADGACDFEDAFFNGVARYRSAPLPMECWITDHDPEASTSKKRQDAYGQVLAWTTAGQIASTPRFESEWRHPLDIIVMAALRKLGEIDPQRVIILEQS